VAEQEAFRRLCLAYHETILKAYKEAQDSQAAFVNNWERMQDLQEAVQNSAAAVHISQVAFAEGATDFNRVYLLQLELVRQQDSLAETQGQIAQSLVNLYVALGGGWDTSGVSADGCATETLFAQTPVGPSGNWSSRSLESLPNRYQQNFQQSSPAMHQTVSFQQHQKTTQGD
jgi:hypothetical protein